MYFTHLVSPHDLTSFDVRRLAEYDRYIFVITLLEEDADEVVRLEAARLEACDALCFVVGPQSMARLLEINALKQLLESAETSNLSSEGSRICTIDRQELLRSTAPRGRWYELFLRVDDDPTVRRSKMRSALVAAVRDDAGSTGLSSIGLSEPGALLRLVAALAKLIGVVKGVS